MVENIKIKFSANNFRIHTKKILPADIDAEKKEKLMATGEYNDWTVTESPFLYLTAELPPPPLFKDELHENIIPQINLVNQYKWDFKN